MQDLRKIGKPIFRDFIWIGKLQISKDYSNTSQTGKDRESLRTLAYRQFAVRMILTGEEGGDFMLIR